jgi:hypothetical protein
MARVTYSAGRTIALPNYESLRVDVALTSDMKQDETSEQAWNRIKAKVDARLNKEVKEIQESVRKAGGRA